MPDKSLENQIVLAIDSAMNGCGAAICFSNKSSASVSEVVPMVRGQAEALVPLVVDVCARAGVKFDDIDLIVTTRGPGTFTGLRVGLSAARSFALALNVPLVGYTTLEVLARAALNANTQSPANIAVVVESKRSDFYFQLFDRSGTSLTDPVAMDAVQIQAELCGHTGVIVGDGVERLLEEMPDSAVDGFVSHSGYDLPDPQVMAEMALSGALGAAGGAEVVPLYLREADVSFPKQMPRILEKIE